LSIKRSAERKIGEKKETKRQYCALWKVQTHKKEKGDIGGGKRSKTRKGRILKPLGGWNAEIEGSDESRQRY